MLQRALNLFRFRLGEFLLRGTFYRVLVMIGFVTAFAVTGGLLAHWLDPVFAGRDEAIWWAFLRLTDPGYLGDDQGAVRRTVSLLLTVAGYVIFLGALVAIMTQWLSAKVRELESGLTPMAARNHVMIAGWTDRTVSILREMFRTEERSRSLLRLGRGAGRGRLMSVVLAEDASPELHQTLRDRVGEYWRERQIILRKGEPIYLDHLRRADFANAAAILLPGDPYQEEGNADSDTRIIKAIASIGRYVTPLDEDGRPPLLVAELFDGRREPVARSMYAGPMELLCSDRLIGGMLAQTLRFPGLAAACRDVLFAAGGERVRLVAATDACVGRSIAEVALRAEGLSVLGYVREGKAHVCPPDDPRLRDGDALIVFGQGHRLVLDDRHCDGSPVVTHRRRPAPAPLHRVLVLGWTRRVPALLSDLEQGRDGGLGVEVISMVPTHDRERDLQGRRLQLPTLRHTVADYTVPEVLRDSDLESFDAVLLVGSDRLESGSESDARTIAGVAALRTVTPVGRGPRVLVELMDAENAPLVEDLGAEYLVTPMVVGRVLAQVALTPVLREVFDDVFGGGGAELVVAPRTLYGEGHVDMDALREAVFRAGHILLGAFSFQAGLMPLNDLQPSGCDFLVVVYRNGASS